MQQSFAVMLPAIKETFGISPIEIGALMAAREIAMGVSSLPGGVLSDRLGRFLRFIMAAVSPVVAGVLYQAYGMRATLFFTAALFVISAVIFAGADLTQTADVTENQKKEQ